ncbi:hypothetical protein [Candidatus Electronema sp. PJ]|jgi:hypothetical protein|uniref:hypothetical protein n=1 Tax=Candidatus Electronema sp. PJ TaxID=3401572 RepID=UPI003AA98727
MATWSYEAFASANSGRDGISELEHKVMAKLESLGARAEHAKTAMTNVIGGMARAVVYYPDALLSVPTARKISGWRKGDANTIADSSDTERYKEEMYQSIVEMLNALSDTQAAWSKISATACKNGCATITIWYPTETA